MPTDSKPRADASHHVFLLEEGRWVAEGTYWQAGGGARSMRGSARIVHAEDVWVNESETVVGDGESPVRFRNRYEVRPLRPGESTTTWTSESPAVGRLRGTFSFVGDVILSAYESDDGRAVGHECLWATDDGAYEDRGVLFVDGELDSRWSVRLERGTA